MLWSQDSLSEAVVEAQLVESISVRTVGRILSQAQIKPYRVKMWCHSEDPRFQERLRDIVRLYVETPSGEPVLCVDEKSGMQALSRARGLIPPQGGRWGRLEYKYKRQGTRCLSMCEQGEFWVGVSAPEPGRTFSPSWIWWQPTIDSSACTWCWTT